MVAADEERGSRDLPRTGHGVGASGGRPPAGTGDRLTLAVAAMVALLAVAAWWSGRDEAHPARSSRSLDVCALAEAAGVATLWPSQAAVTTRSGAADPKRGQAGSCRFVQSEPLPETLLAELMVATLASLATSDSLHTQDTLVRHVGMLEWERGLRIGQPGAERLGGPWREAYRFASRRAEEPTVIVLEDHGLFVHWRGAAELDPEASRAFLERLLRQWRPEPPAR